MTSKAMRDRRCGGAILEFSLVLPVMVLLFLGTVFFGYDFHVYNRLEESVRAGARYGSMRDYDAYSEADPAITHCSSCTLELTSGKFLSSIQNVVAYGCDPAKESGCTATPVVEGIGPGNVTVTLGIVKWAPNTVTVSIKDLPISTPFGKFTVSGKPATSFQYTGNYWPACEGCK
jgi:Flp pilus assembly protein TadG